MLQMKWEFWNVVAPEYHGVSLETPYWVLITQDEGAWAVTLGGPDGYRRECREFARLSAAKRFGSQLLQYSRYFPQLFKTVERVVLT